MELLRIPSSTIPSSLTGSGVLTLVEKTKFRVQTKESSGVWTDLIEDQVPNSKKWSLRLDIKVTEEGA